MKQIQKSGLALAAFIGGAAMAAPAVAGSIGGVTAPHPSVPSFATTGSLGATAGTTAAGSVGRTSLGAAGTTEIDGTFAAGTGGAQVSTGAQAGGSGGAGLAAPGAGLSADELAKAGASGSLDSAATVRGIRETALWDRDRAVEILDTRVDASRRALDRLQDSADRLGADARRRFDAAIADSRAAENALRRNLRGAGAATVDTWDYTRDEIAKDYDAYAAAVARAEIAAGAHAGATASD
jgi:hypothetical protein